VPALREYALAVAPGSAASTVTWLHRGQLNVTVIVKATFGFALDADMARLEPDEILRADVHWQKNPARSTRAASDLAPYLGMVDVVFTGHAQPAAGAGLARTLPVRLTVIDGHETLLDKRLLVHDPAGFDRIPIVYERAYGGAGIADNPMGVGGTAGAGTPNVFDPADARRPAGFGPLGRSWPSRKHLLGKTPRKLLDAEIARIPDDFAWPYYQVAPADQQIARLGGGAWILLEGLSPTASLVRMRLPDVRGLAYVYADAAEAEGLWIELTLDTLHIDGDDARCHVVFRGSFPVEDEASLGAVRIAAGVESAGMPLAWPDEAPVAAADPDPTAAAGTTGTLELEGEAATSKGLPFAAGTVALAADEQLALAARPAVPFVRGAPGSLREMPPPRIPPPPPPSTGTLALEPEAPPPPPQPPAPAPAAALPPRAPVVAPSLDTAPAASPSPRFPPPPPKGPPEASPALKQGLYGKFRG